MVRRAQNMRLLSDIYNDDRIIGRQSESQLPTHVLELIFSHLDLKDNIRASAVCRRWHEVSLSIRRANTSPWLMYVLKSGNMYEFFDPSQRRSYYLEFPELRGFKVRYAKFGWLMLFQSLSWEMSMFCPYTREMIELPELQFPQCHIEMIAFSAPPMSPECVFFTIGHINESLIFINKCRPGDAQWEMFIFTCPQLYFSTPCCQIVFSADYFVCLAVAGDMGFFNTKTNIWGHHKTFPEKCFENPRPWRAKYMAELDGDFFLICTRADAKPAVYKMDQVNGEWVELESLEGMTIFANHLSSHARTGIVGNMVNNVVFSKIRFCGKRVVMFSPGHDRYYPCNKVYDWEKKEPLDTIWIEPPEDLLVFN